MVPKPSEGDHGVGAHQEVHLADGETMELGSIARALNKRLGVARGGG